MNLQLQVADQIVSLTMGGYEFGVPLLSGSVLLYTWSPQPLKQGRIGKVFFSYNFGSSAWAKQTSRKRVYMY
jgi:hypothetical protein